MSTLVVFHHRFASHLVTTSLHVRFLRLMRYQFYNTLTTDTGPLYDTFDIDYGTLPTELKHWRIGRPIYLGAK